MPSRFLFFYEQPIDSLGSNKGMLDQSINESDKTETKEEGLYEEMRGENIYGKILEILLKSGADPNHTSTQIKYSPLHIAVRIFRRLQVFCFVMPFVSLNWYIFSIPHN